MADPPAPAEIRATRYDDAWLAQRREDILEPDLPIVDAHHHLGGTSQPYLLDEILADISSGHNVRASVYIEARAMYNGDPNPALRPVGEVIFANSVAMQAAARGIVPKICAGIVGYADLALGAGVQRVLEAEIAAAKGRFRGIRHSIAWHEDSRIRANAKNAARLNASQFREGFTRLRPLGLSCDIWAFFFQLPDVADLADAFPETAIVLNHLGGPLHVGPFEDEREEVFAVWKSYMAELARRENVFVKLGGLGMTNLGFHFHAHGEPPHSALLAAAWRPYVETCISLFGAGRCMFESNFPVDKRSCSYAALWNGFKHISAGYSPDEKTSLFNGTARKAYRA